MAYLALRKSIVDPLPARVKRMLRHMLERVELGDPAVFRAGPAVNAIQWLVWDVIQLRADDGRRIAVFGRRIGEAITWEEGDDPEPREVGRRIRQRLDPGLDRTPPPDDADAWAHYLSSNGAPPWMRITQGIPATWQSVET